MLLPRKKPELIGEAGSSERKMNTAYPYQQARFQRYEPARETSDMSGFSMGLLRTGPQRAVVSACGQGGFA